jgi:pyruvate,water dikinase
MVHSRVSGVVQTVNVAQDRPEETVIDVGLGLGEGVVSGRVEADHVVVRRAPGEGALSFRYTAREKLTQVVFDARAGRGTRVAATRYHQRLRPALEYRELEELVQAAWRLEAYYRRPLNLEFALEGPTLWILQVRPVPHLEAVVEETRLREPFPPSSLLMEVPS